MFRKVWLGLLLGLLVAVVVGQSAPSQATTCRRFTVWIMDTPYFSHPICFNLPGAVEEPVVYVQNHNPAAPYVDRILPPQ